MLTTLAAITGGSKFHPYVILLNPGQYDLGSDSLVMKPWVSIRGSNTATTYVYGNNINYLVRTASNTDIGGLGLENTGGFNRARTLCSYNVSGVAIHDMAVTATNDNGIAVGHCLRKRRHHRNFHHHQ